MQKTRAQNNRKKHFFIANAIVATIVLSLAVCGSFFDYKIAKSVYIGQLPKENFFGVTFAFIGILPTFAGWSFLGAILLALLRKHTCQTGKRRALTALAILLFVLSFFYLCNSLLLTNKSAFSVHWAIAYPVGIAVIALVSWLGYRMAAKSNNPHLLKRTLFLIVVSLVTMVLIMLTKEIMSRPRYRLVLQTGNDGFFKNWWQSGKVVKDALGSSAVNDEFASFPSGHSAYSMFAVFLFPFLAEFSPKLQRRRDLLFLCGFIWWGLTAFSRLTVGAHYLTDVSIAGLVTILTYLAAYLISAWNARRTLNTATVEKD